MKKPLISIIIPTYKRGESLIRTLKSIEKSVYKNLEVVVVDMGNSTKQIEKIINREIKRIKRLKILSGYDEMYVSGAINEGIRHTSGDYILICADDVVIEHDTITKLVNVLMEHKNIGIVCPICCYLENPKQIWWAGSKISMWTSRTYFYGRDLPLPSTDIYETDSFTTIALIRRDLFFDKNGELSFVNPQEFPIHNEEADFSLRAKAKGWKVCVTKDARAYHDVPIFNNKNLLRLLHIHSPKRAYFVGRNRILLQKKYSNTIQYILFIIIFNWIFFAFYLKVILFATQVNMKERIKIMKAYINGIVTGLSTKINKYPLKSQNL